MAGTADDAGGFAESQTFDPRGRTTGHTSFEGVVREHLYDDFGRVYRVNFYADAAARDAGDVQSYQVNAYDERGRMVGYLYRDASDPDRDRTESMIYDDRNRLVAESSPEGWQAYGYDVYGRMVSTTIYSADAVIVDEGPLTFDQSPERVTRHHYNAQGQLTGVSEDLTPQETTDEDLSTTYDYDHLGRMDRAELPGDIVTTYEHDPLGRLTGQKDLRADDTPETDADNPVLAEYDYQYRADGKKSAATESFHVDANEDGTVQPEEVLTNQFSYSYDDAGRLVEEVLQSFDETLDQTERFTYDAAGNRTTRTIDFVDPTAIDQAFTYEYDAADRLLAEYADNDGDGLADRTTLFDYEQTQLTSKRVHEGADDTAPLRSQQRYQYNLQGRLSAVVNEEYDESGTLTSRTRSRYRYDSQSYRVGVTTETDGDLDASTDDWVLESDTEFLAGRHTATGYTQTLVEKTYDSEGQLTKRIDYTVGADEIAQTVTQFAADGEAIDETTHVFGHDGGNSVRMLYELAGSMATVAQIYTYAAYGEMLSVHDGTGTLVPGGQSASLTSLGYRGEQFDTATQQQYLRARFYDAGTGRFNRLDDFAGRAGNPQSFHKYAYGHGDPANNYDPTGMFSIAGISISMSIGGFMRGMNIASRYAAKQAGLAVLETGFEFLIAKTINGIFFPGEPLEEFDAERIFLTNFASNLLTGKIKSLWIRNTLDIVIRSSIDIAYGDPPMYTIGVNIASVAASETLQALGKKMLRRFHARKTGCGGCFIAGTTVHLAESRTSSIEQVQVGQRVSGKNPETEELSPTRDIDPLGYRIVKLQVHESNVGRHELTLLRTAEWVESFGIIPGKSLVVSAEEAFVDGRATVVSVERCADIEGGIGNLVVSTVATEPVDNLLTVELDSDERIIGTTNHLIWSSTREDWVELQNLTAGERLLGRAGEAVVTAIMVNFDRQCVYNFEVAEAHVYEVSDSGVLVHNCSVRPGWAENYIRVLPSELTELAQASMAYRVRRGLNTPSGVGRNVATVLMDDGTVKSFVSAGPNLHSEKVAELWMKNQGRKAKRMYTDRTPCDDKCYPMMTADKNDVWGDMEAVEFLAIHKDDPIRQAKSMIELGLDWFDSLT